MYGWQLLHWRTDESIHIHKRLEKTGALCIGAEECTWIRDLPSAQKIRGYGETAANVFSAPDIN